MLLKNWKIGWNFPVNDDGQENGLNDPGIETFKDNPLSSLAREVLQNSLDAADGKAQRPVEVHFQKLDVSASEFPGLQEFVKTLEACRAYWKGSKHTTEFFGRALDVTSKIEVPILKISDFNTTGLVLGTDGDRTSDWFKITKSVGVSDKNSGKLGSFGIGKHAPFACSDLRTVFYGTKDLKNAEAFQGVSKLVSYKKERQVTQGTGYFGVRSGNKPIRDFSQIPKLFERKRTGADLYVMGFHPFPDWEMRVIKSVIESFFVAIHESRLIAKVGRTTLNKLTLPEQIRKHYAEPDPHYFADEYFQVLISDESTVYSENDFCGFGGIRLRILENKNFKKKVAMFRRSGMKIYDKGHFQTPLRFAGVFTVEGAKLDALLRTLEPPSHNAWEQERGENPIEAKRLLKDLNGWISEKVRRLMSVEDMVEIDADGISQYLPDELEDADKGTPQERETLDEEPSSVLDMSIRSSPNVAPIEELGAWSDQGEDGQEGGPTDRDPTGDGGAGNGGGRGGQTGSESAEDTGTDHNKRVRLTDVRIYCSDANAGKYRILFQPENANAFYLRIFVIGEVGTEPASISFYSVNGGSEVQQSSNRGLVGPLLLPPGKRAIVEVMLKDSLRCALGVTAHAG